MPTPDSVETGLASMLMQLAPWIKQTLDRIKPLIDQPVERTPFNLPLSAASTVLTPGAVAFPLLASDFQNSLEWPFEIHSLKFSQDPAHTFRDWRVNIVDITFSKIWMKSPAKVVDLVQDNTGAWALQYPFIMRPKGGQLQIFADNLDLVNPLSVDISFQGFQLIPRAGAERR